MGVKRTDLEVTSFPTKLGSYVWAGLANSDGVVILGWFNSTYSGPTTTASTYAPGCIMFNISGSSTSTVIRANSGTTASPTWTVLNIN